MREIERALANSIAENEQVVPNFMQLRDRVAELEALLAEAQIRQENLEDTIRKLLTTDQRPLRPRKSQRFRSNKGKCQT